MYKIVIYDNDDIVFSKSVDSELKEVNIKTNDKEINFTIDEKLISRVDSLLKDDKFWE